MFPPKKIGKPFFLLFSLVLLAPCLAFGSEVSFHAAADRQEMGLEDTLLLTVTLTMNMSSGEYQDLVLPETPDFNLLSTRTSRSTSLTMHNGPPSFSQVRVFSLTLSPRKKGTLVIQPGSVVVKGKTYKTEPIRITVKPGKLSPSRSPSRTPPSSPFGALDRFADDFDQAFDPFFSRERHPSEKAIFLRSQLDKRQVFLGEQTTFSIYLFSRGPVVDINSLQIPKLDPFWSEEIPSSRRGERRVIEGVTYWVYILKRFALFPLQSGKLNIDPVRAELTTGFLSLSSRNLQLASQPLSLEVLPLPSGSPPGFSSSNVGRWKLSAEATPLKSSVGQPITLRVSLIGVGNLHDIAMPPIPSLPGMRVYDPTVTEKSSFSKRLWGGNRVLEYLLMPQKSGSYTIPSLQLTYFNPRSKKYESTSTQPISLKVTGSANLASANDSANNSSENLSSTASPDPNSFRPIRYRVTLQRPPPPITSSPFFVPLLVAPWALWLGCWGTKYASSLWNREDSSKKRRQAAKKARARLRGAHRLLKEGNPDVFYAEVSKALQHYLADKLGSPIVGLTRADLSALLTAQGISPEFTLQVSNLLDICDAGRFAPGGDNAERWENIFQQALRIMSKLETARWETKEETS